MPNTTATTQPASIYLRNQVLSASPEELRMLLLDGAVKFARQGRAGMEARNYEAMYNGISQCRNIIFELLTSIRDDTDLTLASRVKGVYTFMYTHLLEASHEKDISKLDKVIGLLEYERETWAMVMDKLAVERGVVKNSNETAPLSIDG